jgi:hypothetical protein
MGILVVFLLLLALGVQFLVLGKKLNFARRGKYSYTLSFVTLSVLIFFGML